METLPSKSAGITSASSMGVSVTETVTLVVPIDGIPACIPTAAYMKDISPPCVQDMCLSFFVILAAAAAAAVTIVSSPSALSAAIGEKSMPEFAPVSIAATVSNRK